MYNTSYNELYHYGVPGMKWGQHLFSQDSYDTGSYNRRGVLASRFAATKRRWGARASAARRAATGASRNSTLFRTSTAGNNDGIHNVGDQLNEWDNKIRTRATTAYGQARRGVSNAYNAVRSGVSNAYNTVSTGVNNAFKSVGLHRYQSAILIGGGIALAAGATAAGVAAYKHHKKKQAEKNSKK